MADAWIIRVQGKEYGPVNLETLREWKAEGRVIATNEARHANADTWQTASDIPELFAALPVAPAITPPAPRIKIFAETFRIYRGGFSKFLGLTLLVIAPALVGQALAASLSAIPNLGGDARSLLGSAIAFCAMLLTLILTPVYIAGIQLLSAELHFRRKITFGALLNDAARFWPRVAFLWIYTFCCYAFWTIVPVGLIFTITLAGPSFIGIFLMLLLLCVFVWMFGRLFVNFLFWQQFAVLDCCDVAESLRRSKELARSRPGALWYKRPMWRGIIIASLWFAVVFALNFPEIYNSFKVMLNVSASVGNDPQMLVQKLSEAAQRTGGGTYNIALGILQAILKPLLGIAFVLLYFDSRPDLSGRD